MDRIGAIMEAMSRENRLMVIPALVPFSRRFRLSVVAFGLLCFLSGFWTCNAQANYAMNGQCFATGPEALDSFNSRYPYFETATSSPSWWSVASSSLSGQNLSVILRLGTVNQPLITVAVPNCAQVTNENFDSVLGGAFWAFGFAGVMILYFSSHVIGLVLKSVRHG